ncbi:MAG: shikimate kinase [Chloracidobacterium sp.]|nr:shikimate kinase [Chloracidobacterium sp.]MDW8216098.1 shikimate kinase [Acidobacteriota bacterium]
MTSAARMGTALGLGLDAVPSGGVVFLVGFMGCGKTTVGRRLATLLQGSFVDLDEYIERAAGRTIPDLFRLEGEAGFRRREQAALVQLCAALANDPTPWKVVALGGGTFTVEANRDCVRRNGCSVWLDVPFEVLAARIMRDGGRPLWTSQADAEWRYWRRRADYAHADIHLPVGDRTPDQAAAAIAQALAAWQNLRP